MRIHSNPLFALLSSCLEVKTMIEYEKEKEKQSFHDMTNDTIFHSFHCIRRKKENQRRMRRRRRKNLNFIFDYINWHKAATVDRMFSISLFCLSS
jgi:hypothetical protein